MALGGHRMRALPSLEPFLGSRSFLIHLYFLRKGISILTMQRAVAQRGEVTTLESHSWQESNPGLSDSNAQAPGL